MTPRSPWTRSTRRAAAAVLLALMATTAAGAQPDKKEPDKKEPTKEPTKEPEVKWPTEIGGKDIHGVMKNMEDPDPVVRENAVNILPLFGPAAQKPEASKLLVKRMKIEPDPGVKIAVFTAVGRLQFEYEPDNREALRILALTLDTGAPGGLGRLHAIETVAAFGPRGEGAITALTGAAMHDPAYTTRKAVATALGSVGLNETTGPNMKALQALAGPLARDPSAAVRMEAMMSLMLLGPPWAELKKADDKTPPAINTKGAGEIIQLMRLRVGDPKAKPPMPALEKDKQVEIWERAVLMRFDSAKEINDENLDAIGHCLTGSEVGMKLQALAVLRIFGAGASKKHPDVLRVMEDKDATLDMMVASLNVLATMGAGAKPVLPNLRKFGDEKRAELKAKDLALAKKRDDVQLTREKYMLEELIKVIDGAIKIIDEAKMVSPADEKKDPPKK